MTAQPVLMLTPKLPSPLCCLVWAAAFDTSLCAPFCVCFPSLFHFFSLSARKTDCKGQKRKYCFGEIWLGDLGQTCVSVCVRALAGSDAAPGNWGKPHLLCFKQQPASACMGFLYYKWSVWVKRSPAVSLLAFKLQEITNDDIRVGERAKERPLKEEKHLTCLFWENGIPLLISSW